MQTYPSGGPAATSALSLLARRGLRARPVRDHGARPDDGRGRAPEQDLDETVVAYVPPDVEEIEEEEPPPPEEEEPPPELEEEPPQLSLDQLDIALNPGTGGSLAGDFAMPTIGTSARDLGHRGLRRLLGPRPDPAPDRRVRLQLPARGSARRRSAAIVLLLKLDERGGARVRDRLLEPARLRRLRPLGQVKRWRFTPPTQQGRPVKAKARLPIPINIQLAISANAEDPMMNRIPEPFLAAQ